MHYEELDEDYAVVVERSPLALSSVLPQALAKKQFGKLSRLYFYSSE